MLNKVKFLMGALSLVDDTVVDTVCVVLPYREINIKNVIFI